MMLAFPGYPLSNIGSQECCEDTDASIDQDKYEQGLQGIDIYVVKLPDGKPEHVLIDLNNIKSIKDQQASDLMQ